MFPSGRGNPRVYFGAKRRQDGPEGPLQDSSWSCWSTGWGRLQGPTMRGRPATHPCARDRWKLTVFFWKRNIYGTGATWLVPVALDLAPWICCSSSWGRMDPGQRSSEGAREELSRRGTLPAPGCGLRGLQKPTNALPKAAGSHWGWYILGCSRGKRGLIQTIRRDQEPVSASLPGWSLGIFFFLLQFFLLPTLLSLSPSGLFLSFAGAQEFS